MHSRSAQRTTDVAALCVRYRRGFDEIAELLTTHGTEWWRARQLAILVTREMMMLREFPPWGGDGSTWERTRAKRAAAKAAAAEDAMSA